MVRDWLYDDVVGTLNDRDALLREWALGYLVHFFPARSVVEVVKYLETYRTPINEEIKRYLIRYGKSSELELVELLTRRPNEYWTICEILIELDACGLAAALKENFINKVTGSMTTEALMSSFSVLSALQAPEVEWLFGGYYSSLKHNTHQPLLIQACSRGFMNAVRAEHFNESLDEVCLSLHTKGVTNIMCSIAQFLDSDIYTAIAIDGATDLNALIKDVAKGIPGDQGEFVSELQNLLTNHSDSNEILTTSMAACADFCVSSEIDFLSLQEQWEDGILVDQPLLDFVKIMNIMSYLASAEIKGSARKTLSRYGVAAYLTLIARGSAVYTFDYVKPELDATVALLSRNDSFVPDHIIKVAASFGEQIVDSLRDLLKNKGSDTAVSRALQVIAHLPDSCRKLVAEDSELLIDIFLNDEKLREIAYAGLRFVSPWAKELIMKSIGECDGELKEMLVDVYLSGIDSSDREDVEALLNDGASDKVFNALHLLGQRESLDALAPFVSSHYLFSNVQVGIDPDRVDADEPTAKCAMPDEVEPVFNENMWDGEAHCYFYEDYEFSDVKVIFDQSYDFSIPEPHVVTESKEELDLATSVQTVIVRLNGLEPESSIEARNWADELMDTKTKYGWTGKEYHPRMSMEKLKKLDTGGAQLLKKKQQRNKKKKKRKK